MPRLYGLEELRERLRAFPAANRRAEMADEISDDVVDLFAVVGRHDEITDKVRARYAGLADTLSLFAPTDTAPGPLGAAMADIRATGAAT